MTTLRRRLALGWRGLKRGVGHRDTRGWPPYSRLFLMSDHPSWVLAYEMQEIAKVAARAGVATAPSALWPYARRQSVFYASHLSLLSDDQWRQPNRLGMAYLHGKPGSGFPEFDRAFEVLTRHHDRFDRIQVSHSEMRGVVLQSGIAADRVALIPLGIDLQAFPRVTPAARAAARARFGIPAHARVIGSFQKDGVGWSAGTAAKLVKGPDVFLSVVDQLRHDVPDLFVLLSGPARGFVSDGLRALNVPFAHHYIDDPRALAPLYHSIDVYLVPSRQEGGPKAVLESMSSGVALVTTRVGQASDLVEHQRNGWIVDVEDVDGLAQWTREVLVNGAPPAVLDAGRVTAEANTYDRQQPLWERLFDGFVERTTPA